MVGAVLSRLHEVLNIAQHALVDKAVDLKHVKESRRGGCIHKFCATSFIHCLAAKLKGLDADVGAMLKLSGRVRGFFASSEETQPDLVFAADRRDLGSTRT